MLQLHVESDRGAQSMSDFETLFRRCPSCGKRFEIRITGKRLVKEETVEREAPELTGLPSYGLYAGMQLTPVSEDRPVIVDVKEFQYAYLCKHCGHRWYEIKEEEGGHPRKDD